MALSKFCIEQHKKEEVITRRWLCWGLVCASGFHVALVPLLALNPIPIREEPERIELIVTSPVEPETPVKPELEEPLPEPEQPTPKAETPEELEQPEDEPEDIEEPEDIDEPEEPEEVEEPLAE